MKFALAITLSLVLLGVGCTQMDKAVLSEEISQEITETEVITPGVTNVYYSTNYFTNYVVSPGAKAAAELTNGIPGWGGLISTGLAGLLGVYASIRNKQKGRALAEALVLANEAGRNMLRMMPDGNRIDDNFKRAMVDEQVALGKANEITRVVRKVTRPVKKKMPQ